MANNRKKYCDFLWALLVKARAGFQSELSGKTEALHSHHLRGKAGYILRYNLDNGISLTSGEHKFMAHNTSRQFQFESAVKSLRGKDIFDRLEAVKNHSEPRTLAQIEEDLSRELKGYKSEVRAYYESKNYKSKEVKNNYKKLFEYFEDVE